MGWAFTLVRQVSPQNRFFLDGSLWPFRGPSWCAKYIQEYSDQGRHRLPFLLTLPTDWLTLPTDWLTLPTDWLTLPTNWLTLPTDWLTLPTNWLTLPTDSSDWLFRLTDWLFRLTLLYALIEPALEIMALFVLPKLILQMCMRKHPVWLDVWFFVGPFVYFHTSYVRTAKALARLCGCAGSPEPSLVAYVISTIISWAGSVYGKITFSRTFTIFQKVLESIPSPCLSWFLFRLSWFETYCLMRYHIVTL